MKIERKGLVVFQNQDVTVVGPDLMIGAQAPDFLSTTKDWTSIRGISQTVGKVRIIGSLPSLSTSVCDREVRKFNQEAVSLSDDVIVLMISMDLPYTLKSWCGSAGVERVMTLSDYIAGEFGEKYGVFIKEFRVLRRAIFVVDRNDEIVYVEYMPSIGDEPDYQAVLFSAKRALE